MPSSKRLVGLLTGTFDPVHLGHVAMARAARAQFELDEVWFLVNPDPGHKVGVTSYKDRMAMARLSVAGESGFRVYSGDLAEKSHNIDVFLTMINQYPKDNFVFIVGADVLQRMKAWEGYGRVVREAQFVAARRFGVSEPALDGRVRVRWFDFDEHVGASSRDIRVALGAGDGRPAELDGRVYDYILQHKLYGT